MTGEEILARADAVLDVMCTDAVDRVALHLVVLDGDDLVKGTVAAAIEFKLMLDDVLPKAPADVRARTAEQFASALAAKLQAFRAAAASDGTVGRA